MSVSSIESSSWIQMPWQSSLANGQSQPTLPVGNGLNSIMDSIEISLQAQLLQMAGPPANDANSNVATGASAQVSGVANGAGVTPAAIPGMGTESTGSAAPHHHHHHHGGGGQGSAAGSGQNSLQSIAQALQAALSQGAQSSQASSGPSSDVDGDGDGQPSFIQQLAQSISQDLLAALGQGAQSAQAATGSNPTTTVGNSTQSAKPTA